MLKFTLQIGLKKLLWSKVKKCALPYAIQKPNGEVFGTKSIKFRVEKVIMGKDEIFSNENVMILHLLAE